jgi:chromosome segregation ATPase
MNSKPVAIKYLLPVTLVAFFSIALIAWGDQKQTYQQKTRQAVSDTIPKNKVDKKIHDLDDVIDELDRAELKLNMEKIKTELEESLKKIDIEKVKLDMEKAMNEIDMVKIKTEMEKATKQLDVEKMEKEIKESLAKVDWEKMKLQMDEMKEQMEEVKKIDMSKFETDMKKVEKEMKELGPKIEKEMAKAKVEIEKAKEEMKEYKSFVDGLEKDGLINKKENYTIQHKNGELIINGKKQPAEVYNKYRSFLEKHKKFTMKKTDDDFNIDNDDDD